MPSAGGKRKKVTKCIALSVYTVLHTVSYCIFQGKREKGYVSMYWFQREKGKAKYVLSIGAPGKRKTGKTLKIITVVQRLPMSDKLLMKPPLGIFSKRDLWHDQG